MVYIVYVIIPSGNTVYYVTYLFVFVFVFVFVIVFVSVFDFIVVVYRPLHQELQWSG